MFKKEQEITIKYFSIFPFLAESPGREKKL